MKIHILDFIKALILTPLNLLFPFLTYKGVVETQIKLYNKWKKKMSEQEALNALLLSRINVSFGEITQEEAKAYYSCLINDNYKNLEDVVKAIVSFEYFDSMHSRAKNGRFRKEVVESIRIEYMKYIEKRLKN